jgi:hypothetical protein
MMSVRQGLWSATVQCTCAFFNLPSLHTLRANSWNAHKFCTITGQMYNSKRTTRINKISSFQITKIEIFQLPILVCYTLYILCTDMLHVWELTPWSRVLLEKLTGRQLVKKFPAFYGNRRFITALTRACHLSLSWAISIQSMPPHPHVFSFLSIYF